MDRRTTAAALLVAALALSCADSPADPDDSGDTNLAPTAEITSPADGSALTLGDPVQFEGSADDPEDGPLDGPFLDWTSSLDGRFGIGRSVTVSDLTLGEHRVTLTATDSDGATAEDEISLAVAFNREPSVAITAPATGSVHADGDVIRFEGTATDPEDGPLSGESLGWRSSQDGTFGSGESVELTQPSVGFHRIVLFAVDSHDACGWDDIFVEVKAAGAVALADEPSRWAASHSGIRGSATSLQCPEGKN